MTIDDALTSAFSDYQALMLTRIKADGADEVRRRVHRRQRNRLAATTAVAVSAVAVSAGLYLRPPPDGRPVAGATPSEAVASPGSTPASDAPPSASAEPSPSAEPSESFKLSSAKLDVAMRGPSEVIMRPAGDRYHGTLTVVAASVGTGTYRDAFARFVLPEYADLDYQLDGMSACLYQDRPDTPTGMRVIECTIDYPPIPAMGGRKTFTVGLVANPAPQSQPIEATGCRMEFVILGPGNAENHYNPIELKDATPNDNRVTFKLKLLPS